MFQMSRSCHQHQLFIYVQHFQWRACSQALRLQRCSFIGNELRRVLLHSNLSFVLDWLVNILQNIWIFLEAGGFVVAVAEVVLAVLISVVHTVALGWTTLKCR